MDALTPQQERAEKDARLIRNMRRWSFTPPERRRIQEIGDELRAKPVLTRKEAFALREIDAFWERDQRSLKASLGPHALEG